jgi:Xaa-Pro dipeptidase
MSAHVASPFTAEEYRERVERLRARMRDLDVEAMLVASPEDIYYQVGLNHQGYFAFPLLLPANGKPMLVMRSMERATLVTQAPDVEHVGFPDDEEPATAVVHAIRQSGLAAARLGIAKISMYLPVSTWERVTQGLPKVHWEDLSGLVTELR